MEEIKLQAKPVDLKTIVNQFKLVSRTSNQEHVVIGEDLALRLMQMMSGHISRLTPDAEHEETSKIISVLSTITGEFKKKNVYGIEHAHPKGARFITFETSEYNRHLEQLDELIS